MEKAECLNCGGPTSHADKEFCSDECKKAFVEFMKEEAEYEHHNPTEETTHIDMDDYFYRDMRDKFFEEPPE